MHLKKMKDAIEYFRNYFANPAMLLPINFNNYLVNSCCFTNHSSFTILQSNGRNCNFHHLL